ncbi:glycine--tRNA ligase subunit beta [Dellaglioa algida]|uniref:glycine--tRNA ligase subunit beta n=1 Tax=Dellaglioa algida TaxID=105612 RepID=UPI0024C4B074|nr:glycine--tRNA ligase subunit beta [Dellaglioa algida]MDK1727597.1 glycine--tRNA ligase subunit beta [Dellaglioa algida]MDK1735277.1 glycine--tRNA ligase subunit beta [Dellaglioa algida]MDK1736919.1 glycine--tRNA ligase subunit beta [Dellaglioa algida]
MTHSFLLEIGLEEIPAHVVTPSQNQLVKRVSDFLTEQRLSFGEVKAFSTPRRLAVEVTDLADKQEDIQEEAKGPAKKIALDDEGNWSNAAKGFVRGQGVTTDEITFKELKGVEYVYVNKFIAGKAAKDILVQIKAVIEAMTFPTMMHWANYDFKYVRPIRWLVALLDNEVIPFSILNIESGRQTQGHRFLGKAIDLETATEYVEKLATQYVIVDSKKRKETIRTQINALENNQSWHIIVDEDLLEEVNNLVEYPTVFSGHFDEKYLDIPDVVLMTSMKDHQRFFYVRDQNDAILPMFVSVRNGTEANIANVEAGNEKVLTARLEDAAFFYQEDQKQIIDGYVERLKNVTFHDKIGSTYEKMERVQLMAQIIGKREGLNDRELALLQRASEIYKFDLVTGMVGEFSELQGIMGEKYALLMGEDPAVAQAVSEHYMPISADGELPKSKIGAVLAIADKLDSISSFFSVGLIPTGSNDPYALRRQAFGVVRIVESRQWRFSPLEVLNDIKALATLHPALFTKMSVGENDLEVLSFINDRMKQWFSNQKVSYDVIESVIGSTDADLLTMAEAAVTLEAHKKDSDFRETIEAVTRVLKLADKNDETDLSVEATLLDNVAEKELFERVETIQRRIGGLTPEELYHVLSDIRPLIENYFDQTMVMVEDAKIKQNRLNQLSLIAKMSSKLGDLEKLNIK